MGSATSKKCDKGDEGVTVINQDGSHLNPVERRNLLFPNEILEKILSFLSTRDILIAREVCQNWLHHIHNTGILEDSVRVRISSDDVLHLLASTLPVYTRFYFYKIDVTRQSMVFWAVYNESITHLEFYDCSIVPRRTSGCNQPDFILGCPNLEHLSLVNCDKYFLMGGKFIQLHEILHLKNLRSLRVSHSQNLTDTILFSILDKTEKLEELDLSDCLYMVFMKAVHNRFYPAGSQIAYSDNVLSFHILSNKFLSTPKAKSMKRFNFGMRFNSTGMECLLANDEIQWESANLESPELKVSDLKQFLNKFRVSLRTLEMGKCKLNSDELEQSNLTNIQELSLYNSRSISNLNFLKSMKALRKLRLDDCNGFEFNGSVFAELRNLSAFYMNGIRPIGDSFTIQEELKKCFQFNNLIELDVGNCPFVTDDILQQIICNSQRLKWLNLESTSISDVGTTGISTNQEGNSLALLTELQHLNLSFCREIGEGTWTKAIKFINLKTLTLSNCSRLSKQGLLNIIDSCRNLEKMVLMHCSRPIVTDPEVHFAVREKLYRCREFIF